MLTPDPSGVSLMITGWSGLSAEYVNRVNTDRPVRLDGGSPSKQAFESGRPVAIRDISAEPEFTPWGGVAREQGYRAIVCVPLIAGDEVLGTLNGYHTPVHTFTAYEIERLALLANHAAIALTSARRLDQLRQLNESLREQRDALTRSEQIHERLLAVTLRSGGLSGIAAVLTELIGRPVLIDDPQSVVLATAGDDTELPDAAWRAGAVVDSSSSAPVRVSAGAEDDAPFCVSIAKLGDDATVARIWFPARDSELDAVGVRAVEHASIVISLELLRVRTAAEVEHRLRGELLADLLGGGAAISEQVLQRAQRLGHDLTRPHVMIVGALSAAGEPAEPRTYQRSLSLVGDLVRPYAPRPLSAMHRGNIVTMWPISDDRARPVDRVGHHGREPGSARHGLGRQNGRRDRHGVGGSRWERTSLRRGVPDGQGSPGHRAARGAHEYRCPTCGSGRHRSVAATRGFVAAGRLRQADPGSAARLRRIPPDRPRPHAAHVLRVQERQESGRGHVAHSPEYGDAAPAQG